MPARGCRTEREHRNTRYKEPETIPDPWDPGRRIFSVSLRGWGRANQKKRQTREQVIYHTVTRKILQLSDAEVSLSFRVLRSALDGTAYSAQLRTVIQWYAVFALY